MDEAERAKLEARIARYSNSLVAVFLRRRTAVIGGGNLSSKKPDQAPVAAALGCSVAAGFAGSACLALPC
jgi:hypothetical protein